MFSQFTHYLAIAIVISVPITGIILLIDRLYFKKNRAKDAKLPAVVDWAAFLFPVVLVLTVLRSFIAEPFIIPSGSMQPTLYAGDMIVANRWSFGLRYPITNKRIFSEEGEGVDRGDIAVFKYPVDPRINYIKRIVGIPGDVIDYKNKELTVNGVPVQYEYVGAALEPETDLIFKEFLPSKDGVIEHGVQRLPYLTSADRGIQLKQQFPFKVPKGQYLAFGDNRDNSADSRFWGFVSDDQLVGKANFIWMNYKCVTQLKDCDHIFTILK